MGGYGGGFLPGRVRPGRVKKGGGEKRKGGGVPSRPGYGEYTVKKRVRGAGGAFCLGVAVEARGGGLVVALELLLLAVELVHLLRKGFKILFIVILLFKILFIVILLFIYCYTIIFCYDLKCYLLLYSKPQVITGQQGFMVWKTWWRLWG